LDSLLHPILLTAQVISSNGIPQDAYLQISPLVVEQGEWGWDVAGSPNWDNLFFTSSGKALSTRKAQNYYKNGFSLDNLKVIKVDATANVDTEYDRFAELFMSTDFIRSSNLPSPLDGKLPTSGFASYRNEFWAERMVNQDLIAINKYDTSGKPSFIVNYSSPITWNYKGYSHTVFELSSGFFNTKDVHSQLVEISVIWSNSLTGRSYKRTYKKRIKANQRFTVADRIKQIKSKGSTTFSQLYPRFEVHFIEDEAKDPLEVEGDVDGLSELYKRNQDTRYDTTADQKKTDIAAVREDYENNLKRLEEEQKAKQLAAEEAKKREEERRKYMASDEYKEQERLRRLAASVKEKEKKLLDSIKSKQAAKSKREETKRLLEQEKIAQEIIKQKKIELKNAWKYYIPRKSDTLWEYVDSRNNQRAEASGSYKMAHPFHEETAWVTEIDGTQKLIDKEFNTIAYLERIRDMSHGYAIGKNKYGNCIFINENGHEIDRNIVNCSSGHNYHLIGYKKNSTLLLNSDGSILIDTESDLRLTNDGYEVERRFHSYKSYNLDGRYLKTTKLSMPKAIRLCSGPQCN